MKHSPWLSFHVACDRMSECDTARAAVIKAGGRVVANEVVNLVWSFVYVAERSLEPEINAAIVGKSGERVS